MFNVWLQVVSSRISHLGWLWNLHLEYRPPARATEGQAAGCTWGQPPACPFPCTLLRNEIKRSKWRFASPSAVAICHLLSVCLLSHGTSSCKKVLKRKFLFQVQGVLDFRLRLFQVWVWCLERRRKGEREGEEREA